MWNNAHIGCLDILIEWFAIAFSISHTINNQPVCKSGSLTVFSLTEEQVVSRITRLFF